ncbi:MAG: DUF4157 domain-containing protein [Mastigocoleus sp.]
MAKVQETQKKGISHSSKVSNLSGFLQTKKNDGSAENVQTQLQTANNFAHSFGEVQAQTLERGAVIQPKLAIGEPGDKYEQEADRVASEVVQKLHSPEQTQPPQVQKEESQEGKEEDNSIQTKPIYPRIQRVNSVVQRQLNLDGGTLNNEFESSLNKSKSGGQPLQPQLRMKMENVMGNDFSGVKVHTDSNSDQLNRSVQARAFTTGKDIFFKKGEYEPGSKSGQELIAHELTHVVQQGGSQVQQKEIQKQPVQTEAISNSLESNDFTKFSQGNSQTSIQRQLLTLGEMDDEPNSVTLNELETLVNRPLTEKQRYYLTKLQSLNKEYIFSKNSKGKVIQKELNKVINSVKEDVLAVDKSSSNSSNLWNLELNSLKWSKFRFDKQGMDWGEEDDSGKFPVTLDLKHFKHLTPSLREKFEEKNQKTGGIGPVEAMNLDPGLTYTQQLAGQGVLDEFGILGDCLISYTANPGRNSVSTMSKVKTYIQKKWATIEPNQLDPRHAGSHSGYDMGSQLHFHLVKAGAGKWTRNDLNDITQYIQNLI